MENKSDTDSAVRSPDELTGSALKQRYIGNCCRLPLEIDYGRFLGEMKPLLDEEWKSNPFRQVTHQKTVTLALRNNRKPLQKDIEKCEFVDLEAMGKTPYTRSIIHELIPGTPCRCILAAMSPNSLVALHQDNYADYYDATFRLHIPVTTSDLVSMYFGDLVYKMKPGEVWAVNNDVTHGVINDHSEESRIHLIMDFVPDAEFLDLVERGDRNLGNSDEIIRRRLTKSSRLPSMIRSVFRGFLKVTGKKIS